MYGRTNRLSKRLSRRQRHVLAAICGLVLLVVAGLGFWSVFTPDSYSSSSNGCVNLTIPGTTGGSVMHYCGSAARTFCRAATAGHNQISGRARPQCRAAGLLPAEPSGSP